MLISKNQYWVYFFAVMSSLIGINLFVYTQGWYVLDISGNNLSVGLSWSLFFTPGLFLLPILGKLLDSSHVKGVLVAFEFLRAAILIIFIPILYFFPKIYVVYLMSAFFGFFFATFYPSIYVVLKRIVPDDMISKYSHMFELSIQIASSVSILISGFLYKKIGFFSLTALGAAFIFISAFLMYTLKLDKNISQKQSFSLLSEYKNFFGLFKEMLKSEKQTKRDYLFGIFHQFPQNITMAANIPLLLYVYETMHKGPVEYGILDALVGVAAMFAGIFWTRYYKISQRRALVILMPFLTGLSFFSIGLIPAKFILPYILFYIMATFLTSAKIQCRAAVLKTTSKEMIGRLTSLYQTVSYILTLSLAFLLSYLSQCMAVQNVFFVLGAFMFVFVIFLSWAYRPQ